MSFSDLSMAGNDMPKGRGSNKRRAKYQKDNQKALDAGSIKLIVLYEPIRHRRQRAKLYRWDDDKGYTTDRGRGH